MTRAEEIAAALGEDDGSDCECTCAQELAEKLRAALADVARLTEERDKAKLIARSVRQSAHDSAANFRRADVERLEMRKERDEARAALAAAVAEEREACAAIADGFSGERPSVDDYTYGRYCAADEVAQAIRARAGRAL